MIKHTKYTKEQMQEAMPKCKSLSQLMRYFGVVPRGNNYSRWKQMLKDFEIDIIHYYPKIPWNKGVPSGRGRDKDSFSKEVLVLDGPEWRSDKIKKKIIEYNMLPEVCSECGQSTKWNKKKLVLHLDHINGNCRDNRIENLRMLCPNCHSQTEGFCRKKKPVPEKE